jgi:hypothetical protein
MERQPLSFFLKGVAGLAVLFVVTLFMPPSSEVDGLRASIAFGLGLIALKVVLRHFNIDFPPRRHRPIDPPRRPE